MSDADGTLPRRTLNALQNRSLIECPNASGKYARRVSPCPGSVWPSPPSGLTTGGLISEVPLTTGAWAALPTVPLTGRNAICIQNLSGEAILINYVDTVGVTIGIMIPNGGQRYYDIGDSIILYGRAVAGTPSIIIEEIA